MLRTTMAAALLGAATLPAQFAGIGTVMTLTNDATDNRVEIGVHAFGRLLPFTSVSTGGTGTADGLGSQSALAASDDGRHVLAVNPGSDSVTLFRARGRVSLDRRAVAPTGGLRPTSVDVHDELVYVLNADSDDVTGFHLDSGALQMIGRFPLSGAGVAAAQVGFDPAGEHVVVTERATNRILVFPVQGDGSLGTPTVNTSAAETPFGFEFRRDGTLIVSEAVGGQPEASRVSSYRIADDDTLRTLTAALPTQQTAACWVALPSNGRFAYTTNTRSSTVSGFDVDHSGALVPVDASGATGTLRSGARPIDAAFDASGRLLFVLDSGNDEIALFGRTADGGLIRLDTALSLPDGAAGLLAR